MAKNLREFLTEIEEKHPEELLRVEKEVNPADFDVTAILQHLENQKKFPMVLFENPLNTRGEGTGMKLLSNVFASRERCAVAMGLSTLQSKNEVGLLYAEKEKSLKEPVILKAKDSPVKEVIKKGDDVNLYDYPIVRHHEMDPAPYFDMTVIVKDLEKGFYNGAFQRTMVQGERQLGIYMSWRHNLFVAKKYEEEKMPVPLIIVVGHHPAFYLGSLNLLPYGINDYGVMGGFLSEPLRLTSSETWGDGFLVPADAEMVIEGEMLPWEKEAEAPFGEYTGYYGPQRHFPIIRVKAVTHRKDPILQHTFVGHRDVAILGGIPKEGGLLNAIKGVVPSVTAVHFPTSGAGRFYAFISIRKTYEGSPKQAALTALAHCDFIKFCVIVDEDIDVFNEEEVWWAVATRTQPSEDFDILRKVKSSGLDPTLIDDAASSKMIVDATMPLTYPFASRVKVPDEAMQRIHLEDFIDRNI